MTTKAKSASITQKLLAVVARSGVRYENLVTAFLIERLVARFIADESLCKSLVFKGGFVSMKAYDSARHTVDLDALLLKSNIKKTLERTKTAAESDLNDGVWYHFESQIDLETQGKYGGIRQVYRAGIGEKLKSVKKAQIVNFDLGFGDPVTPGPVKTTTASLVFQEELIWSIYPIETMIAEKIHALVFLGSVNSRSKDVYDLGVFLPRADAKILKMALKNSFSYRKTELPEHISRALKQLDTTTLERGWKKAIAYVANAPQFKVAFQKVVSCLEQMGF
jgi:hypothetical protein